MPNPPRILREIAGLTKNEAIKVKALELAAELETQHNQQNNNFQNALSNAELGIDNQLDELRKDIERIRSTQSDAVERQLKMLEMLEDVQTAVRKLGGDAAAS